jgi:hypothetical protein
VYCLYSVALCACCVSPLLTHERVNIAVCMHGRYCELKLSRLLTVDGQSKDILALKHLFRLCCKRDCWCCVVRLLDELVPCSSLTQLLVSFTFATHVDMQHSRVSFVCTVGLISVRIHTQVYF